MSYRWEDDAYPDLDEEGWTEEELMIAAGRASYLRRLRRRHNPECFDNGQEHPEAFGEPLPA